MFKSEETFSGFWSRKFHFLLRLFANSLWVTSKNSKNFLKKQHSLWLSQPLFDCFIRYSTTRAFYAQTPISLTLLIHFYSCSGTVAVNPAIEFLAETWPSPFNFSQKNCPNLSSRWSTQFSLYLQKMRIEARGSC